MQLKQLSWRERGQLWIRLGIRLVLVIAVALLLKFAVPPLLRLFMPFVLAVILAWVLNPMVRWLQKKLKISRKFLSLLLILLVCTVVGGALSAFLYGIGTEIYQLMANWDSVGTYMSAAAESLTAWLGRFAVLLPDAVLRQLEGAYGELAAWVNEVVPSVLTSAGKYAGNIAMSLPAWVVAVVIFLMASYFITADYPQIRLMVTERMNSDVRAFLSQVRKIAVGALGGYIKAQFILSVGVFFILLFGFALMRQGYGLLLAFVLAVMDFIPIIGSGTIMVPWTVISLFLGDFRTAAELMVVWGVIVLFRRLAEPKVVGDQTGLSPILSLVSIYVGMQLAGVPGMVLGPVVLLVMINICRMGVFSGLVRDMRLGIQDMRALLAVSKKEE